MQIKKGKKSRAEIAGEYISDIIHNSKYGYVLTPLIDALEDIIQQNPDNIDNKIISLLYYVDYTKCDTKIIHQIKKVLEYFVCPVCQSHEFNYDCGVMICLGCNETYYVLSDKSKEQCNKCYSYQINKCEGIETLINNIQKEGTL